jgi:drug/metabolite transporter (DMT)-like permease
MPTEPTDRRMGRAEWLLLILLSVLWGGSFFFNQIAVAALPPLTVVAVRVALAAAILWAVLRGAGSRWPSGRGSGRRSWAWASSTTRSRSR